MAKKAEIEENTQLDEDTKARRIKEIKTESGCTVEDLYFFFTLPQSDNLELIANGAETQLKLENISDGKLGPVF